MKNKLKFFWGSTLLFFSCSLLSAQENAPLTLEKAVGLSIKNNKNLVISRFKIEEAKASVIEATNNRLPDFKVGGNYLRLNNAKVDLKTRSDSSQSNSNRTPNVNQAMYGIANLSLPIFAGGKIKYGIESARLLEKASHLDADQDKEDVIFNTTKAYINLYKSFVSVLLVKENLQTALSRDTNFANLEKNGLLARNDLLKSELQSSRLALSLLDAENNYKIAAINLNLLVGLPENDPVVIDTSVINSTPELKTFEEYEVAALQSRKDILAAGFRKKAADVLIKSARGEAYPTVALTGGYVAAYVPHLVTITNAINIGVGVQYNIANLWKSNSRLLQAKAREQEEVAGQALLNDQVRLSINQDYQNYLLSLKKIQVFEKALIQSTENYRITNNKFNNSLVTLTDLLEADVAKLEATLNIAFAKADAVLAYHKLLQTAGL